MRSLKAHARRQVGPQTVKLKIGIGAGVRAYCSLWRIPLGKIQLHLGRFDGHRPLPAYVLIKIVVTVMNRELMLRRITKLKYMVTAGQRGGTGRNADIE